MSEQEKDENNLESIGEPPPPTGDVVNLYQHRIIVVPGRLRRSGPNGEGNSIIVNIPYNGNPNGRKMYEKSRGIGESEVQRYGVLNRYKRLDRVFGILSAVLGDSSKHERPTIFSIDKYEVTPRIKDFITGKLLQGRGRRRHCKRCDREVTASHIDPGTDSCAYGSPEWNKCRPMGPAIGDENNRN